VTTGTGLGYLILQAGVQFDVGLMWAGALVAAVLALAVFALTGFIARRVIPGSRPMRANHNLRVLPGRSTAG